MAAEIKEATDIEATLVAGAGGVFDVEVDGELIYSRHETGFFPEPAEIMSALSDRE